MCPPKGVEVNYANGTGTSFQCAWYNYTTFYLKKCRKFTHSLTAQSLIMKFPAISMPLDTNCRTRRARRTQIFARTSSLEIPAGKTLNASRTTARMVSALVLAKARAVIDRHHSPPWTTIVLLDSGATRRTSSAQNSPLSVKNAT